MSARPSHRAKLVDLEKLRPAYCLEGADQWKLDLVREAIAQAVGGSDPDLAPRKFYLGDVPLEGALELLREAFGDLNTAPMFGPKKLIFLSGLERVITRMRLGASESRPEGEEELAEESAEMGSLSQAIVQAVESYLRRPSPYGVVVFEAERLDKRKALAKLLSNPKLCLLVDTSSAAEHTGWERESAEEESSRTIAAMARELGLVLKGAALAGLAESIEGDLGLARSALLKLRDYVSPRTEVQPADIAELVPEARSGIIFDLLTALAAGKRAEGLALMRNLFSRGEPAPKIVGGLRWLCEVLLRVKELVDAGREREAYKVRGFAPRADEFLAVVRRLPQATLVSWVLLLAETDRALKSSVADETVTLEMLAARMTRAAAGEQGRERRLGVNVSEKR